MYTKSWINEYSRHYMEAYATLISSMAVARSVGTIGHWCYEHDFSSLEIRLLSHMAHQEKHDKFIPDDVGPRGYTRNERGRHWDKQPRPTSLPAPKTAQELLDENFKNDDTLYSLVHKMGEIQKPPHSKTIPCKVVEHGGKIALIGHMRSSWLDWFDKTYPEFPF